jgi:hypothetical protein
MISINEILSLLEDFVLISDHTDTCSLVTGGGSCNCMDDRYYSYPNLVNKAKVILSDRDTLEKYYNKEI